MENDNRLPLAALLAFVVGAALRVPGLWTDLQLDEVWSIENASAATSWFEILRLKIDNNHHLTSLYMHGLGPNAGAALYRVPAYLFGVATVPLAWLVASRDSRTTAVITSVVFATSAALVFYSSEARGYSAVVCLMLAAWFCLQGYADSPKTSYLIGFAVTSVLGMMSHQTFAFFFLGAFIWCDAHMQRHRRLREATRLTMRMFALPAVGIGLFAIVALVGQEIGGGPPFDIPIVLAQTLAVVSGGRQSGVGLWFVAAVSGSLVAVALWTIYRSKDDRLFFYATAGVIAPALIVFLRRPPTLAPRYFLVPAAVLLLAVSSLLARAFDHGGWRRVVAGALITAHVVAGVWFTFSPNASRGGYRAALTHVIEQSVGTPTIASANRFEGSDWRTAMMVRYYARAIGAQDRLRYVSADKAAVEAVQWVIDEDLDSGPASQLIVDKRGRHYAMDRVYDTGPLSGIVWRLYRQQGSSAAEQR
jgi:hypothetical protein